MAATTLPPHILVIDDDPDILRLYTELLTDEGYLVTVAMMPATSLAEIHEARPDLIVLNLLAAHRERGMDVLELLKGDPLTRFTPVLMCSGDSRRLQALGEQLRAWDCGVLHKPFDIDDLVAAVRVGLAKGTAALVAA